LSEHGNDAQETWPLAHQSQCGADSQLHERRRLHPSLLSRVLEPRGEFMEDRLEPMRCNFRSTHHSFSSKETGMKTTFKVAVAALAMLGTTSAARADLSQNGAVGLPLNPTAQIPLPGGVRVQANYYDNGDIRFGGGNFGDTKLFGLYAAGRIGNRLEINGGIERLDADPSPSSNTDELERTGIAIGAKYLFTRETDPLGVRIAAGVGYSRALADNIHAYVVGTKSFGRGITAGRAPITGHLGLRYDRYKYDALNLDTESKKLSVYAGIEIPITRTGNFSFVGELQSKNHEYDGDQNLIRAKAPYSASIRYRPAGQGFSASIGVQRRGYPGSSDRSGIFAQLGYSFGHSDDNTAGVTTAPSP
jgi:hypothetical protein